jgi:hypothetical protein
MRFKHQHAQKGVIIMSNTAESHGAQVKRLMDEFSDRLDEAQRFLYTAQEEMKQCKKDVLSAHGNDLCSAPILKAADDGPQPKSV